MLNFTKLDFYYNNIDINTLNYNHIHLSMSFDKNYTELSTISIASILNTSSPDTYIHLHILGFNFDYVTMEKIIQLKRINKNVEFIFYNGKQAEYDFGDKISNDTRQIADYGKILASQIVNNTNRILIIDSEDVIIQKDISEIFYYDLGNNYIAWILDIIAGNYKKKYNSFFSNNFYPNGGVMLVNVRLFRKDNLYKRAFFMPILYNNLYTPVQDILLSITNYKFKYMPLIFNSNIIFYKHEQVKEINDSIIIQKWFKMQQYTPYKYSYEDFSQAALDPVVNHLYTFKTNYKEFSCNAKANQYIKYAELTGFYNDIKQQNPEPFEM
jgi:hypothetical protein